MTEVLPWLGVGALGAVGALGRFTVDGAVSARWPSDFPFGTLAVNLSGGFALGLLVGLGVGGDALLILGTGLLGGYTTFSTWMVSDRSKEQDGGRQEDGQASPTQEACCPDELVSVPSAPHEDLPVFPRRSMPRNV